MFEIVYFSVITYAIAKKRRIARTTFSVAKLRDLAVRHVLRSTVTMQMCCAFLFAENLSCASRHILDGDTDIGVVACADKFETNGCFVNLFGCLGSIDMFVVQFLPKNFFDMGNCTI